MTLLNILHYPDERLHTVAKPIEVFDEALQKLINDMFETMYAAKGIGLAATQVNVHKRLLVIDIKGQDESAHPMVFINPEIVQVSGQIKFEEGCLSVPGIYETVTRAQEVHVKAFDHKGIAFEVETEGLLAICLQHEIDHLNGKVFIEYLSHLKQTRIRTKMQKLEQQTF